jgi:hypothetical protein
MVNIRGMASSPWMIVVFLIVGWGPLLVCDIVRLAHPDFDAIHFATGWIAIALLCSFLAVIFALLFTRFGLVCGCSDCVEEIPEDDWTFESGWASSKIATGS